MTKNPGAGRVQDITGRLYRWTMRLAAHPQALPALFVIAFLESSIFPLPVEIMLIPMILARPDRALVIALIAISGSVLGGLGGYALGAFGFDRIGQPLLSALGHAGTFEEFGARYSEYGAWAVLFAGVSPFPFKVITILSGAAGLSLPVFLLSSIIARGLRFGIIALLLWKFGEPIRVWIEKRLGLVLAILCVLVLAIWLLAGTT